MLCHSSLLMIRALLTGCKLTSCFSSLFSDPIGDQVSTYYIIKLMVVMVTINLALFYLIRSKMDLVLYHCPQLPQLNQPQTMCSLSTLITLNSIGSF